MGHVIIRKRAVKAMPFAGMFVVPGGTRSDHNQQCDFRAARPSVSDQRIAGLC